MTQMPCISLHQPYASLIFAPLPFAKLNETRGRALPPARLGVRHAIHAAARKIGARTISGPLHRLCVEAFGWDYRETLPRGRVIGTVVFVDCGPTEQRRPASPADEVAGDWTARRFAWRLARPEPLPLPWPVAGRQSWFTVEMP